MPDDLPTGRTIDELVRFHSSRAAVKPMVIDPACRLSYHELDLTTHDLAAAFIEAGVGKGTRDVHEAEGEHPRTCLEDEPRLAPHPLDISAAELADRAVRDGMPVAVSRTAAAFPARAAPRSS